MQWLEAHEDALQAKASGQLVIVYRAGRKRLELEIVCRSRSDSTALLKEFGGRIEALAPNWRRQFSIRRGAQMEPDTGDRRDHSIAGNGWLFWRNGAGTLQTPNHEPANFCGNHRPPLQ